MDYKVCLFYGDDIIRDVAKSFSHHEEALRWVVLKRIKLPTLFGAIIYKRKKYLEHFLTNKGWKIFAFMKEIEQCIITIEGVPPLIAYLDDSKRTERELMFTDMLGCQLTSQKLVLAYTGALRRRGIFAVLLHEIGHAVFEYKTNMSYESFPMRHELEAWQFAIRNCDKVDVRPDYMRRLAKECLNTYIEEHTRKGHLFGCGMPRKRWWKLYRKLTKGRHELSLD